MGGGKKVRKKPTRVAQNTKLLFRFSCGLAKRSRRSVGKGWGIYGLLMNGR